MKARIMSGCCCIVGCLFTAVILLLIVCHSNENLIERNDIGGSVSNTENISGIDIGEKNSTSLLKDCHCTRNLCHCCLTSDTKLNITLCVSLEYLTEEYGFEVNVTLNDYQLVNVKISAKNPPPICFEVPYLGDIAEACIRFHDLDKEDKKISGCIDLEGEIKHIRAFKYEIGCFHMNLIDRKLIGPVVQLLQQT